LRRTLNYDYETHAGISPRNGMKSILKNQFKIEKKRIKNPLYALFNFIEQCLNSV